MKFHLDDDLNQILAAMQTDPMGMVAAGFSLGMRIAKQAGEGAAFKDKFIEVLRNVASGEQTLQPSGAELRMRFPDSPNLEILRTENQKVDRIIAHLIIEYQQRARS